MFGILVCGDSISLGKGEFPNLGWVGRLKEYFESKDLIINLFRSCFNLGIPGDTSTDLLTRFETEIKARIKYKRSGDKFVIMLAVGMNDSKSVGSSDKLNIKPEIFRNNIKKLIKIAKRYTKQVIVVGLTPVDENLTNPFEETYFTNGRIKEYNEILKESAKLDEVLFLNIFDEIILLDYKKLLFDGLHPNKEGYETIYEIVKTFLIKKSII